MGGIFGDGGAAKTARRQEVKAATDEQNRQNAITAGTNSINTTFDGQFTPEYFAKQRQSYLDYAQPQLDSQYADTKKQLTFALDRAGVLDSSIRSQREAELQKLYDTNNRSIADQGLGYENNAKSSVENSRANLIATLNSTGNAQQAANSALNSASSLSQPATYSPLGQLFGDFTSALGTQAALEKNAALYGSKFGGNYDTGLFGVNKNAVRVT